MAYFDLLSDICMNRNTAAKTFIDANFSLEILCCIIEEEINANLNAIEPFIKIIHYGFLDCDLYPNVRRTTRVQEWNMITENADIPSD